MGGSLSKFYSDNQIYNLPLKFRSFEKVDYVRKHLDQRIVEGLEEGGFVTFGIAEGGYSAKEAVGKSRIFLLNRRQINLLIPGQVLCHTS